MLIVANRRAVSHADLQSRGFRSAFGCLEHGDCDKFITVFRMLALAASCIYQGRFNGVLNGAGRGQYPDGPSQPPHVFVWPDFHIWVDRIGRLLINGGRQAVAGAI